MGGALKKFLDKQREAIDKYKWCQSEKAQKDLGQEAVKEWILKFAKTYRREYVEKDLINSKDSLLELKKLLDNKENDIEKLKKFVDDCLEKLEEVIELEGAKNGNGNGNGNGKKSSGK